MKYLIQENVNLRTQPRVTWTNRVGALEVGRTVDVLETTIDKKGWKWGAITKPNTHGERVWFCIQSLNKTYATLIDEPVVGGLRLDGVSKQVALGLLDKLRMVIQNS